jgi:hypothetical protein
MELCKFIHLVKQLYDELYNELALVTRHARTAVDAHASACRQWIAAIAASFRWHFILARRANGTRPFAIPPDLHTAK